MPFERYDVAIDLSTMTFDDVRTARRLLKQVTAEIRRIRRADDRIVAGRLRGPKRRLGPVEVVLTIESPTAQDALELGIATVRSSIHAAGGATTTWNRPAAELAGTGTCEVDWAPTGWAEAA